jgi:hypothetical protein
VIIYPSTDLTQFAGKQVTINGARTARITAIRHGAEAVRCVEQLRDGVWGEGWYDRHGDDRGGNSSFWWPYGTDVAVEVTR